MNSKKAKAIRKAVKEQKGVSELPESILKTAFQKAKKLYKTQEKQHGKA